MKIGTTVLKSRKMGCQEAAFKVTSTELVCKSRKVQNLNTFEPNKRYRILKSQFELDEMEDENSRDIFKPNMYDYYVNRPVDLEHLCLFEFVV